MNEPQKKEETFDLPPVVVQDKTSPYVLPDSSLSKFPVPLQDTPQSVTIIPEKLVEEQGGTTLRDALRNVPGITATAGEGGGNQGDVFTIRGFNARNDIFIDGVRDSGSYFRDVFNFDRVEVLKGPSSTYFGRGSTGGIINQVSKTPLLETTNYSGILSGGMGQYWRGTMDVNQPLTQVLPNAAFRLNLMAHRDNVVERDLIEVRRLGFAPSVAFGLGTPTQVTFSYLLQHENNIPDYGFPYVNGKPLQADRSNFYGLSRDKEETMVNIGTTRLDHRFNDMFSLRNTLRYSSVDRESAVTNPAAVLPNTLNRSRPQRDTVETILDNQTDLTAKFDTFGFGHTATTGIELARETFDVLRFASTGPNTTIIDPNHNQAPQAKTLAQNSDTTSQGFGIYAADQIRLHEYFDIVGGVRWDYFGSDVDDKFLNDKRTRSTSCGAIAADWSSIRRWRRVTTFPTAHLSILRPRALTSPSPPTARRRKKTRSSRSARSSHSSTVPSTCKALFSASTRPTRARPTQSTRPAQRHNGQTTLPGFRNRLGGTSASRASIYSPATHI